MSATEATLPVVTVIERCHGYTRFVVEGEATNPAWTLRPGESPRCDIVIWDGADCLGSFCGDLWPSAWPELFRSESAKSAQCGPVTYLTEQGRAVIEAAKKVFGSKK